MVVPVVVVVLVVDLVVVTVTARKWSCLLVSLVTVSSYSKKVS